MLVVARFLNTVLCCSSPCPCIQGAPSAATGYILERELQGSIEKPSLASKHSFCFFYPVVGAFLKKKIWVFLLDPFVFHKGFLFLDIAHPLFPDKDVMFMAGCLGVPSIHFQLIQTTVSGYLTPSNL